MFVLYYMVYYNDFRVLFRTMKGRFLGAVTRKEIVALARTERGTGNAAVVIEIEIVRRTEMGRGLMTGIGIRKEAARTVIEIGTETVKGIVIGITENATEIESGVREEEEKEKVMMTITKVRTMIGIEEIKVSLCRSCYSIY